jgi:sec-independent protein translocase protein TatA
MPGIPELLLILVIVLLIFGAGKLPAIGDALGRSIKNFRRSAGGHDEIEVSRKGELSGKQRAELDAAGDDDEAEVVAERVKVKKKAAGDDD